MTSKTLQQTLATHAEIVQRFEEHRKTATAKRPADRDFVVTEKQKLLDGLKQRLNNAKKARAEAIKRHDAEIARLQANVARLDREIDDDKKNIGRAAKSEPKRAAKGRASRTKGPPVDRVKGVGKELGARLQARDIRTAPELAAMTPAELADALSVSEDKARALIREARKVK